MTSRPGSPVAAEQSGHPPRGLSFEQFLAWCDEDTRAEWVDGEVVIVSPASAEHQLLLNFLNRLISAFVEAHRLGWVFIAPFLMRLPSRPSGREPDLLFVSNEHAERVREAYLDGPADLVIEIVSPESDERDHGAKFVEYEAAGIPEYWLVDPLRPDALFYVLGPDGRYHRAEVDPEGFFRSSALPGFRLNVAWLWQRPLPPVADVLPETDPTRRS